MLTCTPYPVKKINLKASSLQGITRIPPRHAKIANKNRGGRIVAEVKIDDGIIKIVGLDIQDPKVAKILEEYPENRWCEITRRAMKIGLGYLKGGADA